MRYMKLYIVYLQRAIKSRLEYKKDAIVGIFSFLLTNIFAFMSLMFIVNSIPSLNGWTKYELGFLYGFSMLPKALDHLLTDSLWYIGYWYVRQGVVDRYLIRPINPLFQVIAEIFQPEALGELLMGLVLVVYCGFNVKIHWSFGNIVLGIIAIIFGALIFTSLKLITCSIAFWVKRSGQLMSLVYNVSDFARYPIGIYHPIIRGILMFIIPFGLIISVPVDTALNNAYNPWLYSGIIVIISIIMASIGYGVWCMGLKNYESSGS